MQIKRAPDQTLIAFACHVELLRAVDIGRNEAGEDRSTFIRKAIFAELKRRDQPVLEDWVNPPDRAKKARYPAIAPVLPPAKPSSATPSVASTLGERAAASVQNPGVVYGRKRKAASPSGKTSAPASRARGR